MIGIMKRALLWTLVLLAGWSAVGLACLIVMRQWFRFDPASPAAWHLLKFALEKQNYAIWWDTRVGSARVDALWLAAWAAVLISAWLWLRWSFPAARRLSDILAAGSHSFARTSRGRQGTGKLRRLVAAAGPLPSTATQAHAGHAQACTPPERPAPAVPAPPARAGELALSPDEQAALDAELQASLDEVIRISAAHEGAVGPTAHATMPTAAEIADLLRADVDLRTRPAGNGTVTKHEPPAAAPPAAEDQDATAIDDACFPPAAELPPDRQALIEEVKADLLASGWTLVEGIEMALPGLPRRVPLHVVAAAPAGDAILIAAAPPAGPWEADETAEPAVWLRHSRVIISPALLISAARAILAAAAPGCDIRAGLLLPIEELSASDASMEVWERSDLVVGWNVETTMALIDRHGVVGEPSDTGRRSRLAKAIRKACA